MNTSNCFSFTTINQRDNNEDYQAIFLIPYTSDAPPITVLAVADGMGGHEHGEDVSQQAILKIKEFLLESVERISKTSLLSLEELKRLLNEAILSANELVLRMVEVNGWKQAGSTIVVAAVWENQVIAVNLGDSPLFHYMAHQKKVVQVTQDHSVPGILAQANLISEEMVRYHERRGQLEFFLGTDVLPLSNPLYERKLESGDLLLLCSDGVSSLLRLEQIELALADSGSSLKAKATHLIQAARRLGETDNQTIILWQYSHLSASSHLTPEAISKSNIAPPERSSYSGAISQLTPDRSERINPDERTLIQSGIQSGDDTTSSQFKHSGLARTVQPVRPPRRANRSVWRQLGLLILCILGFASAWAILPPILSQISGILSAINPPPPAALSKPQASTQPSPLDAPGTSSTPQVAIPSIIAFADNGTVLITKGSDGTLDKWKVTQVDPSTVNCVLNVSPETETQQRIVLEQPNQTTSASDHLSTQGQDGCIRRWIQHDLQGNFFDRLKSIFTP